MAVITMLSGKGAPGVTTSVAALATMWPHPVLVVDADPAGGDLVPGWLGQWWVDGWLHAEASVLSFAGATRHHETVSADDLAAHVQVVPGARHARVLTGLRHRRQSHGFGEPGWHRLADAVRDLSAEDGPDVLIDAGRLGPDTPWPLVEHADLVLLALRPGLRHIAPALEVRDALGATVSCDRLGVAVCVTSSREADEVARALGMPVGLELPDDPAAARVLSDGSSQPPKPKSALLRTAARAAQRLHTRLAVSTADAADGATETDEDKREPVLQGGAA